MLDRPDGTNHDLLSAAIAGLTASPKVMSPKWFYDERGSALFEDITRLPEYYPTRAETAILRDRVPDLAKQFAASPVLVELGSGASVKTRILLDALKKLETYVPIDISANFLDQTANTLRADYPRLNIQPVIGDFTQKIDLPDTLASAHKLLFFPGSTIGNLDRADSRRLLSRLAEWPNVDALILGTDLVKQTQTLVRAYDDSAGVTAAFNTNLLVRLNRECGAGFDPADFKHEARWNPDLERIEMHLVALRPHQLQIGNRLIAFERGESIHTENSHKFTKASLGDLARSSGWTLSRFWTDDASQFGVSILTASAE